jgi:inner membrane protein
VAAAAQAARLQANDGRIAWSIIAIVDPLFSIFLLVSVVWGLQRYSPGPARVGLALAGAYLLLGVWQHHDALQVAEQLARERGHQIERAIVKPTIANLLLWRSIYETDGVFHVDAIRLGLLGPDQVYAGASAPRFDAARDRSDIPSDSLLGRDIERFTRLSDGFVIADPARDGVLIDVRYSMSIATAPRTCANCSWPCCWGGICRRRAGVRYLLVNDAMIAARFRAPIPLIRE